MKHDSCENLLILDDVIKDIKEYYPNNIVETNVDTGFTKECLQKALQILNLSI